MIDFVYVIDGAAQHQVKQLRITSGTMGTFRYGPGRQGDYGIYDRSRGYIDSIRLHETGAFVASATEVMKAATEVSRTRYDGVL